MTEAYHLRSRETGKLVAGAWVAHCGKGIAYVGEDSPLGRRELPMVVRRSQVPVFEEMFLGGESILTEFDPVPADVPVEEDA
jgi:hypothetical protein